MVVKKTRTDVMPIFNFLINCRKMKTIEITKMATGPFVIKANPANIPDKTKMNFIFSLFFLLKYRYPK